MFEASVIIGGSASAGTGAGSFSRTDPVTAEVITRAQACTPAMATDAANAAAAAFPGWSLAAPERRAQILRDTADLLDTRAETLIAAAHAEVGASASWTRFNIDIAQDMLRHAATLTGRTGEQPYPFGNPDKAYTQVVKPVGVVLGIAPWNAPVTLAVRAVAGPLALGNTVVLKGSELCPHTHQLVAQTFLDAGVPPGALNYVVHAPDDAHAVVDELIGHPAVRRVNFTGSTRVGREVAQIAARHLKRCLLELSGKAPLIVLEGANIKAAARAAAEGAFFNQGQICMSTDCAIVQDSVAEPFLEAVAEQADALRIRPAHTGTDARGTLINADAAARIGGLIDDAVRKGAVLVTGGDRLNMAFQPTVLDRIDLGMRLYAEETFGPVLSVIRVADADEAVSVANDSAFGLAASVFCADVARATEVARQIEAGIVHINGSTVYDDPALPFGGLKASGFGRFGGESGIAEFTETSFITRPASPACPTPDGTQEITNKEETP